MGGRIALGVLALGAAFGLGAVVAAAPPTALDLIARPLRGSSPQVALAFTRAGLFPAYATLAGVALALGLFRRAWLSAAVTGISLLLATWWTNDAMKALFHRSRPAFWYGHLESSAAYPSGHAALSLAFYGFVAHVVARSSAPMAVKSLVYALCVLMIVGIGWSRLVLGAHYPSDLLGGYGVGGGMLAFASVAYDRIREMSASRTASKGVASFSATC